MAEEQEREHYDQDRIMSAIKDLESTILDALKSNDPFWWRFVQLILPIVLTAILGLIAFKIQSNIQTTLDDKTTLLQATLSEKSARLQAHLSLAQYLYQKRLDAYKELYDKVLNVYRSSQEFQLDDQKAQISTTALASNIMILSELITANRIIASKELNTFLYEAWYDTSKNESVMTVDELRQKIEDQMRKDLFVDALRVD